MSNTKYKQSMCASVMIQTQSDVYLRKLFGGGGTSQESLGAAGGQTELSLTANVYRSHMAAAVGDLWIRDIKVQRHLELMADLK